MTLEIKVHDTVTTTDTLAKAKKYILDVLEKWYNSDDDKPLIITINKISPRGPPSLQINVGDLVSTKTGLA